MTKRATILVFTALILGPFRVAHADCPDVGPWYSIVEMHRGTIVVCAYYCDKNRLLRESVGWNDVVRINQKVQLDSFFDGGIVSDSGVYVPFDPTCCFRDECPPAGIVRYGFAEPYECSPNKCRSDPPPYYIEVEVPYGSHYPCTYSDGYQKQTSWSGKLPWDGKDDNLVCTAAEYQGKDSGCAVAYPGAGQVLSINAAALLLGLMLLIRRKR